MIEAMQCQWKKDVRFLELKKSEARVKEAKQLFVRLKEKQTLVDCRSIGLVYECQVNVNKMRYTDARS